MKHLSGAPDPLPPLAIQYADYAQWRAEIDAQGEVLEGQLGYWEKQLADLPQVHGLHTDRPRPAKQTFNGPCIPSKWTRSTPTRSCAVGASERPRNSVHGDARSICFALSQYSRQTVIVPVGIAVANQSQKRTGVAGWLLREHSCVRTDCSRIRHSREYLVHVKKRKPGG